MTRDRSKVHKDEVILELRGFWILNKIIKIMGVISFVKPLF